MIKAIVKTANEFLNAFGNGNHVAQGLTARNLMDNLPNVSCNDIKYELGEYVQIHMANNPTNNMKGRTMDAIVLDPRNNLITPKPFELPDPGPNPFTTTSIEDVQETTNHQAYQTTLENQSMEGNAKNEKKNQKSRSVQYAKNLENKGAVEEEILSSEQEKSTACNPLVRNPDT